MAIEVKWCAYEKIGEMQAEDNKELFILTPASKNSDRSQGVFVVYKAHSNIKSGPDQNPILIGRIEIEVKNQENDFNYADDNEYIEAYRKVISGKESKDTTNYFSFGTKPFFYVQLQNQCDENTAEEFLNKFNDVTSKPKAVNTTEFKSSTTERLSKRCKARKVNMLFLLNEDHFISEVPKLYDSKDKKDRKTESLKKFYREFICINGYGTNDMKLAILFIDSLNRNKEIVDNISEEIIVDICELWMLYSEKQDEASQNICSNVEKFLNNFHKQSDKQPQDSENKSPDSPLYSAVKAIENIRDFLTLKYEEIDDTTDLFQYTSLSAMKHLINRHKSEESIPSLRFSNSNQMNDPFEGRLLEVALGLDKMEKVDYPFSYFYVSSATSSADSLPLWKLYGDEGKGVCLQYKPSYLRKITEPHTDNEHDVTGGYTHIFRECYIDYAPESNKDVDWNQIPLKISGKEDKINEIRTYLNDLHDYIEQIQPKEKRIIRALINLKISYLFKRIDYSYEKEYRISLNMQDKASKVVIQDSKLEDGQIGMKLYAFIDEDNKANDSSEKLNQKDKTDTRLPVEYSKVIVGPKAVDIDYIAPYIKLCDSNIAVEKSKISYR